MQVLRQLLSVPCGLVARIRRSHRRGRGSIPRKGEYFLLYPVKMDLYLPISTYHFEELSSPLWSSG